MGLADPVSLAHGGSLEQASFLVCCSPVIAWWRRRSKNTRRRSVFYGSLLLVGALAIEWTTGMPGRSYRGALAALDDGQQRLAGDLEHDVRQLATGERNAATPGSMARGSGQIEAALEASGYSVVRLPVSSGSDVVFNLEATRGGTARASEIVVVGAHYDTAPGAPGADDNATGVASLLAIARELGSYSPSRTVRFVAFANEEPPHFWQESMGSLVYAKACKARGDDIQAMLSLESLGYYSDQRGSQRYPPIVGLLYPSTGDFVAFVGNLSSRGLTRDSVRAFRSAALFPSEGGALPAFFPGVGWSDQWSFWQVGYPGVMVTDTAPFRNPSYHTAGDVPATVDFSRLARVTTGLVAVVKKLAE